MVSLIICFIIHIIICFLTIGLWVSMLWQVARNRSTYLESLLCIFIHVDRTMALGWIIDILLFSHFNYYNYSNS